MNFVPYRYGRKYVIAKWIARSSFSIIGLFSSPFWKERDMKHIGKSLPLISWLRTAPQAKLLASTVTMNCLLKSGYCKMGGSISLDFNSWNAYSHSVDQLKSTFFLVNLWQCQVGEILDKTSVIVCESRESFNCLFVRWAREFLNGLGLCIVR